MSKEQKKEQAPVLPDGPVEVATVKRSGEYHVILRSRVSGKVEESVLKKHSDRRIAADKALSATLEVFK